MQIGLVGSGTIGNFLLDEMNNNQRIPQARIAGILDERKDKETKLKMLADQYETKYFTDIDAFVAEPLDLIVECANVEVAKAYAPRLLQEKDLFMISVGALAELSLMEELQRIAKQKNRTLYLPSGAIGGLDVLRSANVLDGLESVALETRKPAEALSLQNVEEPTIIFEGSAKEAIEEYPENINVAIIISLAGIGVEKTTVKIVADPHVRKNTHQLQASGDFGAFSLQLENNPSPTNPKTSYLTSLSILASLQNLERSIVLG